MIYYCYGWPLSSKIIATQSSENFQGVWSKFDEIRYGEVFLMRMKHIFLQLAWCKGRSSRRNFHKDLIPLGIPQLVKSLPRGLRFISSLGWDFSAMIGFVMVTAIFPMADRPSLQHGECHFCSSEETATLTLQRWKGTLVGYLCGIQVVCWKATNVAANMPKVLNDFIMFKDQSSCGEIIVLRKWLLNNNFRSL